VLTPIGSQMPSRPIPQEIQDKYQLWRKYRRDGRPRRGVMSLILPILDLRESI
jgi:hypothetical protein